MTISLLKNFLFFFPFPDGFYMYIEGDSAVHGDTARLLSEECADPQPQCLQFWYHMYGSSWTMGLSVYLLQYGNVAKEVWKMREDQGNMWHLARVDLKPDVKFQVSKSKTSLNCTCYILSSILSIKKQSIKNVCYWCIRWSLRGVEEAQPGQMLPLMTSHCTEEPVVVCFCSVTALSKNNKL